MAGTHETLLTPVAIYSMASTVVMAILSLILTRLFGSRTSSNDKLVLFWLIWDAMIHFILEGSFVWLSLTGTVQRSDHFMALLWKEYAKADSRWGISDPTIVSIEMLTVFVCGPLCLLTVGAICKRHSCRHFLQTVLCVCELYGGFMTFVPDLLLGWPSLATGSALYLWVYLVFYNGIWVVVPLLLLYQSAVALSQPHSGALTEEAGGDASTKYNLRSRKKIH